VYRAPHPDAPAVYRQPPSGFFTLGCLSLFVGIPGCALILEAFDRGGPGLAGLTLAGAVAVIFALYVFFNEEATLTIDARSMRLVHQRVALGLRGPEKLAWELPIEHLTEAREVTHHSPSKNGGWHRNKKLHFPRGITLEPALLGGTELENTPYKQLVASLEARLGERFRKEDDFGPLNAAIRQQGGPPPSPPPG
jgi:hypothetical protein